MFCQKPLTLTLEENQLIRKACQKHKDKVFVVGTQQRGSKPRFLRAVNMVQKGLIGDVKRITVGIEAGSVAKDPFKKTDPPANLDWDMWLGQAPKVDYIKQRCHNTFRWWYEYSGGKLTDWGAHHVDIGVWALEANGQDVQPLSIEGSATHPVEFKDGVPQKTDCYNTATDFEFTVKFAGGAEMLIKAGGRNGVLIEGDKGRIFVSRGKLDGAPVKELEGNPLPEGAIKEVYKGHELVENERKAHWANFLHCVDKQVEPISDVHSHMRMLNICHLAGISARLGRKLEWDAATETIKGDDVANSMLSRPYREGYEIEMPEAAAVGS